MNKEEALELLNADWMDSIYGIKGFKLVEEKIVGAYRHGTQNYSVVESEEGYFYCADYRVPSDDCCDSLGDANEDGVEFYEVEKVTVETTEWKRVK